MSVFFIRNAFAYVLALSLAASPVMAAPPVAAGPSTEQWKYLGVDAKGSQFYYDAASTIYISANVIQVWTRELASNLPPTRKLQEINCSYRIIRDRQVKVEQSGRAPRFQNSPSDWHPMEKDPITMTLYKALCR